MNQISRSHGGDWAGYQAEYGAGAPLLDFSANLSPLGVPEGVRRAISDAALRADRYPDPRCRALRRAIAGREGRLPGQVLCGNGAADLIWRAVLAQRPGRALITAPTFTEYEAALQAVGCETEHYLLREELGFCVQADILDFITPETDMVFLCEPNNPTGVSTPEDLLARIADRCREVGALLVVDACFRDFLEERPWRAPGGALTIKAFTKLYGMAGVRLGYCLCRDRALLDRMELAGQPWPVSSLAQAAGLVALNETEYARRVRALVRGERPRLAAGLEAMGLRVIPGRANYLLFQSAVPLTVPLRERGILLRSCGDFVGLDDSWYRTAVRTREENQTLLAAIGEVLR